MTLRTLLLALLALCVAGGTAFYAKSWLAREKAAIVASAPKPQKTADVLPVLVVRKAVPVGRFLKESDLEWRSWPQDGIAKGFIVKGEDGMAPALGAVARLPIAAGEPISQARIVRPGDQGFLAAVLEPGMRAVSVPINATSGISGFVFPGDKVDVLLTLKVAVGTNQTRTYTKTLLHDVRVLARDQATQTLEGQPQLTKTATLEVTPKQAEIVALALERGLLSLSLRALVREEEQDPFTAMARAVGAMDAANPTEEGRFTSETEILRDLAPPRPTNKAGAQQTVHVLRGTEASAKSF